MVNKTRFFTKQSQKGSVLVHAGVTTRARAAYFSANEFAITVAACFQQCGDWLNAFFGVCQRCLSSLLNFFHSPPPNSLPLSFPSDGCSAEIAVLLKWPDTVTALITLSYLDWSPMNGIGNIYLMWLLLRVMKSSFIVLMDSMCLLNRFGWSEFRIGQAKQFILKHTYFSDYSG